MWCFVPLHCHLNGWIIYNVIIFCTAIGGGYRGEGGVWGGEGGALSKCMAQTGCVSD